MNVHHLAVLAFKLLGASLVAAGLILGARLPAFWVDAAPVRALALGLLPSLVSVALGLYAWFGARGLASNHFDPAEEGAVARLQAESFLALALSILGVLFIAEAVVGLVQVTALFTLSRSGATFLGQESMVDSYSRLWDATAKANAAAAVTRLLLGVAFFLGPNRLASVAARIRREFGSTLLEEEAGGTTPPRERRPAEPNADPPAQPPASV